MADPTKEEIEEFLASEERRKSAQRRWEQY